MAPGAQAKSIRDLLTEMAERLAALEAIAEEQNKRARAEISVLFEKAERTAETVQEIKLDYTPRKEHSETQRRVTAVEERQLRWAGGLALLVVFGQMAMALIGKVWK